MKKKALILGISLIFMVFPYIYGYMILDYSIIGDNMQYYNYRDLEITATSTGISNLHNLVETNSSGTLYALSSSSATVKKSTDKGDNWSTITTRTENIRANWHDRTNSKIYAIDGRATTPMGDMYMWYLDLGDDSINELDDWADNFLPADIFMIGSDIFCLYFEDYQDAPDKYQVGVAKWVDPAFVEQATYDLDIVAIEDYDLSYVVVVGTKAYFIMYETSAGNTYVMVYDNTVPSITLIDTIADYEQPAEGLDDMALAYDGSDLLYFRAKQSPAGSTYLYHYSITGDTSTNLGLTNIHLMLDRNTASGVMEKAITTDGSHEVYQLHPNLSHQYHLISIVNSDANLKAITDNFLMNNDGDMFEYTNVSNSVFSCIIRRKDMSIPTGTFSLLSDYTLTEGMLIKIEDTFTTAGVTSTKMIFEGYVDTFEKGYNQVAKLISPTIELFNIKPSGDYDGRSDEIIVDLINDYCQYVTAGTLSNGGAMGTITFYGDKTMFQILYDLALFDNFIWYLAPEGELYYNNGSVDSGEDFTNTSPIFHVSEYRGKRAINYVKIKGAYVNGVQVASDGSHDDEEDIREKGINPYERVHSHLDTAALCNTAATNILSRYGTIANIVESDHFDATVGMLQEGETITLTYSRENLSISETQMGIREIVYDARNSKGHYTVSDRIL